MKACMTKFLRVWTTLLLMSVPALASHAQSLPGGELTTGQIEQRIEQIESSSEYSEAVKTGVLELYREALENLRKAQDEARVADALVAASGTAIDETSAIRARLKQSAGAVAAPELPAEGSGISMRELEQRLLTARADVSAIETRRAELERSIATERSRPAAARDELARASEALREVTQVLMDAPSSTGGDVAAQARRLNRESLAVLLSDTVNRLQQELAVQPVRLELLEAQRDLAALQLVQAEKSVDALQARVTELRRADTAQAIAETDLAAREVESDPTVIGDFASGNRQLAGDLAELTLKVEQLLTHHDGLESQIDGLRSRFANTRQRLEVGGISPALGRYLGEERRNLPDLRGKRREARLRGVQIAEAGLRNLSLDEAYDAIRDVDAYVAGMLATLPSDAAGQLEDELRALVVTRLDLLERTRARNDEYLRLLADTDQLERQTQSLSQEYADYLAKNLLWVRSRGAFGFSDLKALPGELASFFSPSMWLDVVRVLAVRSSSSAAQVIAFLVLLLFWLRLGALRKMLRATTEHLGHPEKDSLWFTARAVGISLIMTLPWPIVTAVTGYELANSADATEASRAVGRALLLITPLLFFLRGFRILCTPHGVADEHFRWSPDALARMRQQMNLLLFTMLVPGFAMIVNVEMRRADLGGSLSQLLFAALTAGLVYFLYRLLNLGDGIVHALRRDTQHLERIRGPGVWLVAAVTVPTALALLAMMGFMYSAGTLLGKLINSIWLIFGLVFLRELVFRWLLVLRRRLRMQQTVERREAEKQAALREQGTASGSDEVAAVAQSDEVDLVALDADTRTLVHVALLVAGFVGLSAIWSGVLPALGILDELTLWQYMTTVDGVQQSNPVTLADLLLALLAAALTFVAARTVPSLLEVILRQRPNVTAGSRLAFSTLARYTIVVAGLGFVLATIGVNWSKLQWLVAALGVGIGFGLQEIVANFISGIVILAERPIRVGDIVTVGDTSGVVTRVQIRATTIRTWNREELLVPNKEFITGRVLNWSLSDEVIRIHFFVGIAYGSDVETALRLIEEAATEHPAVLDDPAPLVTFESFGDNSLNLGLRCFVSSVTQRLETNTDLHRAINRKFNEAGIVIAFPQRDLHLDSASPIEIKLTKDDRAEGGEDQER